MAQASSATALSPLLSCGKSRWTCCTSLRGPRARAASLQPCLLGAGRWGPTPWAVVPLSMHECYVFLLLSVLGTVCYAWVLCPFLLLLVLSVPYALVVLCGCGRQQLSRWSWHLLARAFCVSEGRTGGVAHPCSAHVHGASLCGSPLCWLL